MEVSYTQATEQGDVQIVIRFRRASGRDGYLREQLTDRLKALTGKDNLDGNFWLFARAMSQANSTQGLPFAVPDENVGDEELLKAWNVWFGLDEDFHIECHNKLNTMQRPANPATGPVPLPADAPKNS